MTNRLRIAVAALSLSAAGLLGILTREDIKLQAYPDPVHGWKVPTIGAGSTEGVKQGDTITPLGAVQRAHREARVFEGRIKQCMEGVELHQHEYDAYIRLAHNIGPGAFCGSTVVSSAAKARSGKASTLISTWRPTSTSARVCSGRVKLT